MYKLISPAILNLNFLNQPPPSSQADCGYSQRTTPSGALSVSAEGPPRPSPADSFIGEQFSQIAIQNLLGAGGLGRAPIDYTAIYTARPSGLGRTAVGDFFNSLGKTEWIIIGVGGALAIYMLTNRSAKARALNALDARYQADRAAIEAKYTAGGRIRAARKRAKSLVPKISFG